MGNVIRLVGPNRAVEILGVKLVGVNAENGLKLLFTLGFIALVLLLGRGLQAVARAAAPRAGRRAGPVLGPAGGPARARPSSCSWAWSRSGSTTRRGWRRGWGW